MDTGYEKGYWKTKDGRILKIKDMETSHLKNVVRLLDKDIDRISDQIQHGGLCDEEDSVYTWDIKNFQDKRKEIKNELLQRI